MSGASSLKFFGKILGTNRDYWIVAGSLDEPPENNVDYYTEKRGDGVNQLVYWVTDNLLNDWI